MWLNYEIIGVLRLSLRAC